MTALIVARTLSTWQRNAPDKRRDVAQTRCSDVTSVDARHVITDTQTGSESRRVSVNSTHQDGVVVAGANCETETCGVVSSRQSQLDKHHRNVLILTFTSTSTRLRYF